MFFKNLLSWLKARAAEKSTYVGLATVATALGAPQAAPIINIVGAIVGTALTVATTTPAAPVGASVAG